MPTVLAYSFVESVKGSYPFWAIRWLGGVLFLSGMLIMAYNMFRTIAGGKIQDVPVMVPVAHHA
jgi:cytochrome c oxidase cbb3-type subunit 1